MILAIDTSAGQCAVALSGPAGGSSLIEHMERGHAEALMLMVAQLTGGNYQQLTRIAVCIGPGSFTGLRVGVSAARGLALGLDIPCIGVSRLEALAARQGPCIVAVKGRGGTLFYQRFEDALALSAPETRFGTADGFEESGMPCLGDVTGPAEAGLVDPERLAQIAAQRALGPPPAPLYLRTANADLPKDAPPRILD
ncbi:MAG: tRNA (adenosine(37)-N6)-threonylcarbamoyltransferase complex dimerization subunit type 1 TsaB [Pseudomonadota bacterium]